MGLSTMKGFWTWQAGRFGVYRDKTSNKLVTTMDVTLVRLSECALAAAAHLAVARAEASTIHYCFRGARFILLDDETPCA